MRSQRKLVQRSAAQLRYLDNVTNSKTIDLSGVPIHHLDEQPVIAVKDLLRQGFKIRPLKSVDALRKELDRIH